MDTDTELYKLLCQTISFSQDAEDQLNSIIETDLSEEAKAASQEKSGKGGLDRLG